jgi:hypothetical protein
MSTFTNADKMKSQVDAMLLALLGSAELVERWWTCANWHFNLETPDEVWYRDPKEVYAYVAGFCYK